MAISVISAISAGNNPTRIVLRTSFFSILLLHKTAKMCKESRNFAGF
jgi:hypothetical protein